MTRLAARGARAVGRAFVMAATLALATDAALAQERSATSTVRGIAYDSLRSRPLAGALVSIETLGRSAISDSSGGFALDGVPAGRHELVLSHEMIDSLGLPEPRLVLDVPGDGRVIRIATPSFNTVWRAACGGRAPNDSGFVHGVVRDARQGTPMAGVDVRATWLDVGFDVRSGVSQERLGGSVTTDTHGRYAMCGVPNGVQLALRVRLGDTSTDEVTRFHVAPGVTHRDFLLPSVTDIALRGVVRGVVRGVAGNPVPNALVQWPGTREARTDAEGRFVLSGVVIGTRDLTIRSIGAQPMRAIADVTWGDTAQVEIVLHNVATLEPVDVVASAVLRRFLTEFEERRQLGLAKFMDSTRAARYGSIQTALTAASNARMSARGSVTFGANGCSPGLWIDRRYVKSADAQMEMRLFNPALVGAIEIYERPERIPVEFTPPVPDRTRCIVIIWTKAMFP